MSKTLIITGGSSGIGLSMCKAFDIAGYRVFNLDITASKVGRFIECDVTDHDQVHQAVKTIAEDNQIDIVISNAGKHFSANIEDTSEKDFLDVINLNVKGAYSLAQACLPHMKANGGSLIFVASDQAIIAKRNSFVYNLTKHALASMAKTTALDYAQYNIRANAICPGTIETPLYHHAIDRYCAKSGEDKITVDAQEAKLQPLGRIGQASEVAAYALFLASDNASFITGSLQVIDGGYTTG